MVCWKCSKELSQSEVYRTSECPSCHALLHCCKGCKFYSKGSHFDCRENIEDPISDKESANFCDFFSPIKEKRESENDDKKAKEAKDAFNALFGGIVCL